MELNSNYKITLTGDEIACVMGALTNSIEDYNRENPTTDNTERTFSSVLQSALIKLNATAQGETPVEEEVTANISGRRIALEEIERAETIEKLVDFYVLHYNTLNKEAENSKSDDFVMFREEEAARLIGEEIIKSYVLKCGYEYNSDLMHITKRN